jgi:hypothetical protein
MGFVLFERVVEHAAQIFFKSVFSRFDVGLLLQPLFALFLFFLRPRFFSFVGSGCAGGVKSSGDGMANSIWTGDCVALGFALRELAGDEASLASTCVASMATFEPWINPSS